ncbi:MAG: hypothetical protein D6754_13265 [Alphaproteobacteria bacterium]|nr:MAG: hypothetical protein D6754_13265 [Alphaproteobacteria bacterium]
MLRRAFLVLALLLPALPAISGTAEDAHRLLELIGFRQAMVSSAAGLAKAPATLVAAAPEMEASWRLAAQRHIDADRLVEAAATRIAEVMSDDELAALIAAFDTPFARRVTALEIAAQDPALGDLPDVEGARLFAEVVRGDAERLELFKALDRGLGAVEGGVATALNFSFALLSGMVASGKVPGNPTDGEIMARVQAQAPAMRVAVMTSVYTDLAYTYRELSNDELGRYIALLTRPETRRLYSVMNAATEAEIARAMRAIGHELMVQAGKRKA